MNLLVTILLAVLIFGVIIIIHELGHFLTAQAAGAAVPAGGAPSPPGAGRPCNRAAIASCESMLRMTVDFP